jgi:hypothetical protein
MVLNNRLKCLDITFNTLKAPIQIQGIHAVETIKYPKSLLLYYN